MVATPEIEIQFDSGAMEYTVVATTSRDEIQSVTVIDAIRSKVEYGVWISENSRQLARNQSRKADLRPLSPKRNRSSAMEDHRNPNFMLERTHSFDNIASNMINNQRNGTISDHRQTLDSAARDQPPNERSSLCSTPESSPILLLERKRSLPPRAPPPNHSFGVRVPLLFRRSVSFGGRNQPQTGRNDPVPSRGQFSNSRNKTP